MYDILNSNFTIEMGSKQIYINETSKKIDWKVTLIDTGIDTLKGARVKMVEKYVDDDIFMVTYGDGVANININKLVRFHRRHKKIGTITGVYPPSRFGELITKRGKVIKLTEKPQVSAGLINGGFFVFNKEFFDYLSTDKNCDLEREPLEKLATDDGLRVYKHKGLWECMDHIRDVEHLNKLWESGKAFWSYE